MLTTKKQRPMRVVALVNPEFDFTKYHDDAIDAIISRFKRTQNIKRLDRRFESDFVFKESDAISIIEACFRMNLPFEVSYKPCYDGCWEINFKAILEKE